MCIRHDALVAGILPIYVGNISNLTYPYKKATKNEVGTYTVNSTNLIINQEIARKETEKSGTKINFILSFELNDQEE